MRSKLRSRMRSGISRKTRSGMRSKKRSGMRRTMWSEIKVKKISLKLENIIG